MSVSHVGDDGGEGKMRDSYPILYVLSGPSLFQSVVDCRADIS